MTPIRTLGNFLRELRLKSELTRQDVADALKTTPQFISNIEREATLPPLRFIKPLAKIYKIPDQELRMQIVKFKTAQVKRKYGFK